jgi:hypothetical protein
MTGSIPRLRDFTAHLLAYAGALVEPLDPDGLEAILPEPVQHTLRAPESIRLGCATELPPGAQRLSLESDWLERFEQLLGADGRHLQYVINVPLPALANPERLVERGLVLHNAVYRLARVRPAWTRYVILLFRYTAISDDKREGLLKLGVNLANGSAIDPYVDELLTAVLSPETPMEATIPLGAELPPDWPAARWKTMLNRALPARVRSHLNTFLYGMQRRLDRDLAQVHEYYTGLRQEAWQRLQKHNPDSAREQLRLQAAEREYQAKVADLRQKYDLRVGVELSQTLTLTSPVQRIELTIKRRKGERPVALDWHPLTRRLDPPPCQWSYATDSTRMVCDDALHLVSLAGHAACAQCDRSFCRACQPLRCPKCGQSNEAL